MNKNAAGESAIKTMCVGGREQKIFFREISIKGVSEKKGPAKSEKIGGDSLA